MNGYFTRANNEGTKICSFLEPLLDSIGRFDKAIIHFFPFDNTHSTTRTTLHISTKAFSHNSQAVSSRVAQWVEILLNPLEKIANKQNQ